MLYDEYLLIFSPLANKLANHIRVVTELFAKYIISYARKGNSRSFG